MKINLPNQITISRLLLAIVFFVLLAQFNVHQQQTWTMDACLLLFVVAGLTDWLDGYLARKRNQITSLGRVLDPFVDKVLVCGAFILLAGPGLADGEHRNVTSLAPWMVVIIIARELLVTGLRGFSESKGKKFAADVFGKVKTVVQMVTAGWIMLFVAHGDIDDPGSFMAIVQVVLVWVTVAITTFSGINYLYKAKHLLVDEI